MTRVVLGLDVPELTDEVLHFLDRSGRARVIATAGDDRQLAEAIRQLEPDVVVAEPSLVPAGVGSAIVLALVTRESVSALRAAVDCGARGFYLWPGERDALLTGLDATASVRRPLERRALVIAVHAARGGAGCTFVASHLARSLRRQGGTCLLIDADPVYGDLTHALGAPEDARTIADLIPVAEEPSWEQMKEVSWEGALLAPPPAHAGAVTFELLRAVAEVGAAHADTVVLHLPRQIDATTRWAFEWSDRVLEVVTLDVLSFKASTRAMDICAPPDAASRVGYVVNRAARSELVPGDIRRVFGQEPLAVLPSEAAVLRAQDRGRLLPPRGRLVRAVDRLADRLLEPAAQEREAS